MQYNKIYSNNKNNNKYQKIWKTSQTTQNNCLQHNFLIILKIKIMKSLVKILQIMKIMK